MANMTLSIPDELYRKMATHSEYKWSEVARKAIAQKIEEAEFLDDLRAVNEAKKAHKEGKTITHCDLVKRLGL